MESTEARRNTEKGVRCGDAFPAIGRPVRTRYGQRIQPLQIIRRDRETQSSPEYLRASLLSVNASQTGEATVVGRISGCVAFPSGAG